MKPLVNFITNQTTNIQKKTFINSEQLKMCTKAIVKKRQNSTIDEHQHNPRNIFDKLKVPLTNLLEK